MKKVTKIFAVVMVLVMMLSLTACGKYKCDLCGEEKMFGKTTKEVLGVEVEYCSDCAEKIDSVGDTVQDGLDQLGKLFE